MSSHQLQLFMRPGPRPNTTTCAPHSQIDQVPDNGAQLCKDLVDRVSKLSHVLLGQSRRAPPGTVGFFLAQEHATHDSRSFLLGLEFAHVHIDDDYSLHAILPEPVRTQAIEFGWAEAHPMAGLPTVSLDTVLIFAPRDEAELGLITDLVKQSWRNALASSHLGIS